MKRDDCIREVADYISSGGDAKGVVEIVERGLGLVSPTEPPDRPSPSFRQAFRSVSGQGDAAQHALAWMLWHLGQTILSPAELARDQ